MRGGEFVGVIQIQLAMISVILCIIAVKIR